VYLLCGNLSKEALMRKVNRVSLTEQERLELEQLIRTGRESASKITRARIVLKAASGQPDKEIAKALDVSIATVQRARRRFVGGRVNAAIERRPQPPRPQKRRLDGDGEARLFMLACSTPPDGREHWTMDLLADRMVKLNYVPAVSGDTVRRSLKKTSSNHG
jgi:transposase